MYTIHATRKLLDRVKQPVRPVDGSYSKTASRSLLGSMNDFVRLAGYYRAEEEAEDLLTLSVHMAQTPCGPLFKTHTSPRQGGSGPPRPAAKTLISSAQARGVRIRYPILGFDRCLRRRSSAMAATQAMSSCSGHCSRADARASIALAATESAFKASSFVQA